MTTWRKRKTQQNQQDTMKVAVLLVGIATQDHSFMLQHLLLFATGCCRRCLLLLLLSPIDEWRMLTAVVAAGCTLVPLYAAPACYWSEDTWHGCFVVFCSVCCTGCCFCCCSHGRSWFDGSSSGSSVVQSMIVSDSLLPENGMFLNAAFLFTGSRSSTRTLPGNRRTISCEVEAFCWATYFNVGRGIKIVIWFSQGTVWRNFLLIRRGRLNNQPGRGFHLF